MTGKMVVTNNGGCNTVGKGRRGVDGKEEQNLAVIKLVDLVAQHSCLPIVVCRSTCDDLDSLCSFLSALPFFSSSTLVSLKLIFFLIISTLYIIFLIRSCFLRFRFSRVTIVTLAKMNVHLS